MKKRHRFIQKARDQSGAVVVLFALLLVVFLGVTALAIDVGHLYVVRNELQNAADAGALSGALNLYNDDGTVNEGANQFAYDTAVLNNSQSEAVEVNWTSGNSGDVERGHWSFANRQFTPNDSLAPADLWNLSTEELDLDTNFINAVRVTTRREATPAAAFFSKIWGNSDSALSTQAIAYIGFAGQLGPGEVDQPIAICQESITIDEIYSCNIGRMINSGLDPSSSNTAGWTSFEQGDSVCSGTNSNELRPLVCGAGNPAIINLGEPIATTGGANQTVFDTMRDCWLAATGGTRPWVLTLPTVRCGDSNNVGNCPEVTGAVTVDMLFMSEAGTAKPEDAPYSMESPDPAIPDFNYNDAGACTDFKSLINLEISVALQVDFMVDKGLSSPDRWQGESTYTAGMARWDCFVDHFQLKNADGSCAPLDKKSMYFLPDCTPHEPRGRTGGENFGVLADIPVLVQ